MADHFLHRYFLSNASNGLHKWVHYFDIYEAHFERFRNRKPTVLEIGVSQGGSLQMWQAYFGEGARILGIDIDPACKAREPQGTEVFIGSQADPAFLDEVCARYAPFDIVIDDGSHQNPHMIASFEHLYDRLSPNGIYLVEDTYACYRRVHDGGLRKPGSFIEFAKKKIDELYAVHNIGLPLNDFTRQTRSISFYDSVVVFEKAPQGARQHPATVAMPRTLPNPRQVAAQKHAPQDGDPTV